MRRLKAAWEINMTNTPSFFEEPHLMANMPPDSPVLLGLSGGADSVSLLHMLCRLREQFGFELYAAHLNHNIRTEEYDNEALRDEKFCEEICGQLNVKLFVKHVDIPAIRKKSQNSLETEARNQRYEFFADCMKTAGIKILATAHNADDNLETIIFNLSRGCGMDGICGIPRMRKFSGTDGGMIVRPILSATKQDILKYCKEHGLDYKIDSTNYENDCTRNRIRHIIIPELEDMFGSPQRSATRFSRSMYENLCFLDECAQNFISEIEIFTRNGSGNPEIPLEKFEKLHIALKKRVLSDLFQKLTGKALEAVHLESVIILAEKKSPHSSVSLPCGFCGKIENDFLVFSPERKNINRADNGTKINSERAPTQLKTGFNTVSDSPFGIYLQICKDFNDSPPKQLNIYKLYTSASIKSDTILPLFVRTRHAGDKIKDGGMSKKIKKLMCDKKVPLEYRDLLPIIQNESEILYVPLCAVSDSAKTNGCDRRICIGIYIKSNENNQKAPN